MPAPGKLCWPLGGPPRRCDPHGCPPVFENWNEALMGSIGAIAPAGGRMGAGFLFSPRSPFLSNVLFVDQVVEDMVHVVQIRIVGDFDFCLFRKTPQKEFLGELVVHFVITCINEPFDSHLLDRVKQCLSGKLIAELRNHSMCSPIIFVMVDRYV